MFYRALNTPTFQIVTSNNLPISLEMFKSIEKKMRKLAQKHVKQLSFLGFTLKTSTK